MRIALALALFAAPACAEGRHDPVLTCAFGSEAVTLLQDGEGFRIQVGGLGFPAALARPGSDGRVVGVFAMLDAGPMMIAVEADDTKSHAAQITAATRTASGLASLTTEGTCTEATP